MKKILMLILGLSFLSFSCSDDDDDDNSNSINGTYNLTQVNLGTDSYTPLEYGQIAFDGAITSFVYTTTFFDTDSIKLNIQLVDISTVEINQRGTYTLLDNNLIETKFVDSDGEIDTETTPYNLDGNKFELIETDTEDEDNDGDLSEELRFTFQK